MITFKWFITEDMESYADDEIVNDTLFLDAYFEMNLNGRSWGLYPTSDILFTFHGGENLPFLLSQFEEYVLTLKDGEEAYVMTLQANLIDFYFKRIGDKLQISEHWCDGENKGKLEWTEEVDFVEFAKVVNENVKEFLKQVEEKDKRFFAHKDMKKLQSYVK